MELVSVLMPVYNQEVWLCESIKSILSQTYRELELVIINDGSTDSSGAIILSFDDCRIRYYHNEHKGIVQALNMGLRYCKGAFIARMDGDDIALPQRVEKQVAFLKLHTEVAMVGSYVMAFRQAGACSKQVVKYPLRQSSIRWAAIKSTPFAHPSIMFRRHLYDDGVFHYQESFFPAEDYELWCRLLFTHKVQNIAQPLLYYRVHERQVSGQQQVQQALQKTRIRKGYLHRLFPNKSTRHIELLNKFFTNSKQCSFKEIVLVYACFFQRLVFVSWEEKPSLLQFLIKLFVNKLGNFTKLKPGKPIILK